MRKKILGIVSVLAAFLMLSTGVLVPVITATDAYGDALKDVISEQSAVIEEYDKYIDAYIDEYGIDSNFTVPDDLEEELNLLMEELQSVLGQPQGGGITNIEIWWENWIFCHALVWLSEWWCDFLGSFGNLGIALIAIILSLAFGLDPSDLIIWGIAIALITYGVATFVGVSEGNGIISKFEGLLFPYELKWVIPQ